MNWTSIRSAAARGQGTRRDGPVAVAEETAFGDAGRLLRAASDLKRVSRRRFLVGSALGLTLAADLFATQQIQKQREEQEILRVRDEDAERQFPTSMWFLFPGFKTSWEETVWILNSLRPALATRGQLAAVGYSNLGLDPDAITAAIYRYARRHGLRRLYFYGHSFGGMLAVQVAAGLRTRGLPVELILLDSSPAQRSDVLDRAMFEGVVFLYDAGYRIPTVLRGGYELGERVLHKNERSWRTVLDQTLAQLSPLAPSSTLIQSESSYIYHFDASRFSGALGDTALFYIGNPEDRTVNYSAARAGWTSLFPANMAASWIETEGARPAHASPQWSPGIYQNVVNQILALYVPEPAAGGHSPGE